MWIPHSGRVVLEIEVSTKIKYKNTLQWIDYWKNNLLNNDQIPFSLSFFSIAFPEKDANNAISINFCFYHLHHLRDCWLELQPSNVLFLFLTSVLINRWKVLDWFKKNWMLQLLYRELTVENVFINNIMG